MQDSSDILGSPRPVVRDDYNRSWLSSSKSGLLMVVCVASVLILVLQLLYPYYRQYREWQYRKAMRRRHGIPDSDHRPFNVAYAAASQTRLEKEKGDGLSSGRSSVRPSALATASQRAGSTQAQTTRQRSGFSDPRQIQRSSAFNDIPGTLSQNQSHTDPRRTPGNSTLVGEGSTDFLDISLQNHIHYEDSQKRSNIATASRQGSLSRTDRRGGAPEISATVPTAGKRSYDDGADGSHVGYKKSRIDGYELVGDDEYVSWDNEADMDVDAYEELATKPKRGAKRMTSHEEDEGFESGRGSGREKRQRKISRLASNDAMDEDEVPELVKNHRGKKRDRADAGSTFGEDGSSVESDNEDKQRRYRRRRIASQHKKASSVRGLKRDRETEMDDSDSEESDNQARRPVRQRRGYGTSHDEVHMEEGMLSNDPLCKGRRIGEEWEVNGIHYKVGPNGQRLRQTLVKKSRPRFPMPKDSEHQDRSVNVDIFVETWLSEEEYQIVKERHELAWQDTPRTKTLDLPSATPQSPTKGKSLLWSQGKENSTILSSGKALKASTTLPNMSLRSGSLQKLDASLPRRLSSFHSTMISTPDSPARPAKTYSKWEKQDLEAAAMSKLREKMKKDTEKDKKAVPNITVTPPSNFPSAPGSTTVTPVVKPAEEHKIVATPAVAPSAPAPAIKPPATFSLAQPAASNKASTANLPTLTIPTSTSKPAEPASTATFPSMKQTSEQAKSVPTFALPGAPASTSGFSFAKPSAPAPVRTPAVPATATVTSNIFGQPSTASAPAAASNSSTPMNLFGGVNRPTVPTPAPATSEPSKFSFGSPAGEKKAEGAVATSESSQASGGSLLSRMGGFVAPAPAQAATPTPVSTTPASSAFSFAKPATTMTTTTTTPTSSTSGNTSQPKFNSDASKPAASVFSFGAPKPAVTPATQPSTTTPAATAAPGQPTEAPKFNFGFGSNSTAASGTSTSSALAGALGSNTTQLKAEPAKPAAVFSFGAPPAAGSSSAPTATTSVFGTPTAMSTAGAGGSGSLFGNAASSGSKEAPKNVFSFGSTPTTSSETRPTPAFGSTNPPATSIFGATTNASSNSKPPTSTAAGSTSAPLKFSFGAASGPSTALKPADGQTKPTFSFGSGFGSAATSNSNVSSAPVFGAPSNSQATSNPFGAPNGATPTFGSGAFTFGAKPTDNSKQK